MPTVAVIGGSITASHRGHRSWPQLFRKADPDVSLDVFAVAGTGYVHGSQPFGSRLRAALSVRPDVLLLAGSTADCAESPLQVATAADSLIVRARNADANLGVLMVGPIGSAATPSAACRHLDNALRDVAQQDGVPYASGLRWLQGKSRLIGADHVHPSEAGQRYLARKMANFLHAHGGVR